MTRAALGYARWVRGTFGWYTLAYLAFWAVITVVSTAQNAAVAPRLRHSPAPLPAASALLAVAGLAWLVFAARVPPVLLNRRDLTRLALTPVAPGLVLTWPLWQARLVRAALGMVVGSAWALLAPVYFDVGAVVAPFALSFVLAASVDVAWLAYAARQEGGARARRGLVLVLAIALACALLGVFTPLGLLSALWSPSPLGVIAPVLLAGVAAWAVVVSLRDGYPPLFASHALMLGQLRALRATVQWLGSRPDADAVRRLQAQLHGGAHARRPTRFLPAPPVTLGAFGAHAWRSALLLYRRPPSDHALTVAWFTGLVLVDVTALPGNAGAVLVALAFVALLRRLIGPAPSGVLPRVAPRVRTLARVVPGAALVVLTALLVCAGALLAGRADLSLRAVLVGGQTLLALVLFEKVTVWAGFPAGSSEAAMAVSFVLVVALPPLPLPVALAVMLFGVAIALRVSWP